MSPIQANIDENNWKGVRVGHYRFLCCVVIFLCCEVHFGSFCVVLRRKMRNTTQKHQKCTTQHKKEATGVMPTFTPFSIVLVIVHLDRRHIRSIEKGVRIGIQLCCLFFRVVLVFFALCWSFFEKEKITRTVLVISSKYLVKKKDGNEPTQIWLVKMFLSKLLRDL